MANPGKARRMGVGAGALAVGMLAAWAYLPDLAGQPWFADESAYLAQTYYYHLLFHRGDPWHEDWQRRAGIEVPPLPKYLFGLALDVAGLDVPTTYAPTFYWYNVRFQPPRDRRMLTAARTVSAVAGIIGCIALFALAARTAGLGAGVLAALLWCVNPLVRMSARRAMGDAITECLVLVTVVLGAALCRHLLSPRVGWRRTCVLGALVATVGSLAINAKLNGAVGLLSVAVMLLVVWGWLVGQCLRRAHAPDSPRPSVHRIWAVPLVGLGTAALAFGLFCLVNPFVAGGGRRATVFTQSARLVEHRTRLYETTRVVFHRKDGTGLFTPADKLWATYRRGFGSYTTLHPMLVGELAGSYVSLPSLLVGEHPGVSQAAARDRWTARHPILTVAVVAPVSALVAVVGLVLMATRWRRQSVDRVLITALPWLAYLVVTTVAVIAFIPLDWDRYYIPLAAPWAVPAGVALAAVTRPLFRRRRPTTPAPSTPRPTIP